MKNKLDIPKENTGDYAHRLLKVVLGSIPNCGSVLSEIFTVIIPPSIEKRREKWMQVVSENLSELIEKDENLIDNLKSNEEFISLLLETSQLALKTHREEKLTIFGKALTNSLNQNFDYFIKETFIRYIDELNPNQILLLKFIHHNQKIVNKVNSYQDFHSILISKNDKNEVALEAKLDPILLRSFLQDLDVKGLLLISDAIGELENVVRENNFIMYDSNENLPCIKITSLGEKFLKMIEGETFKGKESNLL